MKKLFVSLIALCSSTIAINAQQVTFRGLNHCGIYPNEKNLLKQWPEGGPEKLWVVNDAGKGNSSALVSDGFIYTAGLTEDEQSEQITCYKLDGTKVYQVTYGHAWTKSFQETRSTPIIDDDRLYMVSGMGELVCLNRADDMFYMFDERRGMVGLARINPDKLDVVSEFRFTDGSGACFSHPTIFDGVMYIRRGSALVAYNLKK